MVEEEVAFPLSKRRDGLGWQKRDKKKKGT
jgi:hypothetical protein